MGCFSPVFSLIKFNLQLSMQNIVAKIFKLYEVEVSANKSVVKF